LPPFLEEGSLRGFFFGLMEIGNKERRPGRINMSLKNSVILSAAKDLDSSVASLPQNDNIFSMLREHKTPV
jgi:hypothetical protein